MVCDVVSRILGRQTGLRESSLLYSSLYGGAEQQSAYFTSYGGDQSDRLSTNVVRSIIDTIVSRIASKSQPKPSILTEGDWQLRRKAKKLDKAVYGALTSGGAYRIGPLTARDACVYGQGATKVFERDGEVAYERVMLGELFVDEREAIYGDPRSIYHVRRVDKTILSELFPGFADDIEAAQSTINQDIASEMHSAQDAYADHVQVIEAWHLPSAKTAKDGKHVIALHGVTLLCEPWTRDRFPFAILRWDAPLVGWYGTGLAQELCGLQLEINELLSKIKEAHHAITGKWLLERGSRVNAMHINDDPMSCIEYTGTPPQYVVSATISPEIYQHLERLIQKSYEISGISQLAATQMKPAGLNSGTALRAYHEQQSERFLHKYAMFEDYFLDLAKLTLDTMREIAAERDYKVNVASKNFLETIDFKENDLDTRKYDIRIQPSSQLPQTLGGKLEFIEEIAKTGILSPEELLDLLDSPDTELLVKRKNTTREAVESDIEHMVSTGLQRAPEPEYAMQVAGRVSLELYMQLRSDGAPDDVLGLVRDYMDAIRLAMKPPEPPPPPPMPAPPPDMGAPMMPPMGPPGMPPMGPPPPMPQGLPNVA